MKKRTIAGAIGYTSGDTAPRLLASGRGREAERIIALAKQAGITVVEDSALAAEVAPGSFIPVWCWESVTKILAFVFK